MGGQNWRSSCGFPFRKYAPTPKNGKYFDVHPVTELFIVPPCGKRYIGGIHRRSIPPIKNFFGKWTLPVRRWPRPRKGGTDEEEEEKVSTSDIEIEPTAEEEKEKEEEKKEERKGAKPQVPRDTTGRRRGGKIIKSAAATSDIGVLGKKLLQCVCVYAP